MGCTPRVGCGRSICCGPAGRWARCLALADGALRERATLASRWSAGRARHPVPHRCPGSLGGADTREGLVAEGAQAVVAAAGEFAGDRQDGALVTEPGGDLLVVGVVG